MPRLAELRPASAARLVARMPAPSRSAAQLPRLAGTLLPVDPLKRGSRTRLRPRDIPALESAAGYSEHPLFADVARVVCNAGVLPRKELFEAWEVATIVDAAFPTAPCVADLAAGHGLLAWLVLLLAARRGVRRRAVCVDTRLPDSAMAIAEAFGQRWPELVDSMDYVEGSMEAVSSPPRGSVFASVHACGPLSDLVIQRAAESGCALALVPCCHAKSQPLPPLAGLDRQRLEVMAARRGLPFAIDSCRIAALKAKGYAVSVRRFSADISPYNRLLLATPPPGVEGVGVVGGHAPLSLETLPPSKVRAHASGPRAQWPGSIPLDDADALRRIAGRRPPQWCRAMDLSLWVEDESPVDVRLLVALASQAVRARWRPRAAEPDAAARPQDASATQADASTSALDASTPGLDTCTPALDASTPAVNASAPAWDVSAALASAVAEAAEGVEVSVDDVYVSVAVRDEFEDPSSGRRARAFRIEFRSSVRQLTKGDASRWQAR